METVGLGGRGEVSLDIRALTQYSGQGKCGNVRFCKDTAEKYREEGRSWATRITWRINVTEMNAWIFIARV